MTKPILETPPPHAAPERRVPKHVAIIMDGNGRWAKNRLLPREAGHVKGIASVRKVVRAAREMGLQYLTLYTFSTENWRRPESEVRHLMGLFRRYCRADIEKLHKHNVRVRFIGARAGLGPRYCRSHRRGRIAYGAQYRAEPGLCFQLRFARGTRGRRACAGAGGRGGPARSRPITADVLGQSLQSAGIPDADLVIRSGGERRLSNFLLWQAAYAELVFTDKLWPDFGAADLEAALAEYARRDRRFGGISANERPLAESPLADPAIRALAAEIFDAE